VKTIYQKHVVVLAATFNEECAMKEAYQEKSWVTTDTMVDPLESLARLGAQKMLQAALEQEVEEYLERGRYVRNGTLKGYRSGYLPERKITLGSGGVPIKVPRVSGEGDGCAGAGDDVRV
jgi:hypothetical protein